jgi:phage tail tape-measure protein
MASVQFAVDVQRWAEKAEKRSVDASRAIAEAALARVKELTPVRTGTLRSAWTIVPLGEEVKAEGSVGATVASVGAALGADYGARTLASRYGATASRATNIGTVAGAITGAAVNVATGQSTVTEGIGEAAGAVAGTAIGSAVGVVGGPVGITVGGLVGGALGSAAGKLAGSAFDSAMSDKPRGWSIVNPIKYAPFVEYGYQMKLKNGGTKHIEGRNMMTQTMLELPQIATRVIRDLSNVG